MLPRYVPTPKSRVSFRSLPNTKLQIVSLTYSIYLGLIENIAYRTLIHYILQIQAENLRARNRNDDYDLRHHDIALNVCDIAQQIIMFYHSGSLAISQLLYDRSLCLSGSINHIFTALYLSV